MKLFLLILIIIQIHVYAKIKIKSVNINLNPSFECYVTPKMGPPKMTSRNLAQMIKCEYSIIWED